MAPRKEKTIEGQRKMDQFVHASGSQQVRSNLTMDGNNPGFSITDSEFNQISYKIIKPNVLDPEILKNALDGVNGCEQLKDFLSTMVNAYSSISHALTVNYENCKKTAQASDENSSTFLKVTEQLNDEIAIVSKDLQSYVAKK